MNKTAVVILNYNGEKYLKKFLPSVLQYTAEAEIYVADNASTDNSIEIMKSQFPQVHLIELEQNFGFCEGYNQALKQIKATYYVLLNSDVEVTDNWLKPLVDVLDNNPDIGVIQPKVLMYDDKSKFEHAGAAGGYIDKLGYPFCRGRIFDELEKDNGQYDDFTEIFWATGACMCIRADLYHQKGGLDKSFFAHMEEIDLCWRIKKAGYKVAFLGKSKVFHVGGGTLNYNSPRKTYLNFRNSLLMLLKNLPSKQLFPVIFTRLVLDGIAGVRFLAQGEVGHFWAIPKAHFSFYRHLPSYLAKREKNTRPIYGQTNNIIVIEHFLKKKKSFQELNINIKKIQ